MPQFVLPMGSNQAADYFGRLDAFTRGYITAAFWTADEELKEATVDELSPEATHQLTDDCNGFNLLADVWLHKAYLHGDMSYSMEQAGIDFWLTRNRHGAGFWDRELGIAGDKLSEFAHSFGSCDLYRGDDGLLYLT
jgi:hypothetical protein